MIELERSRDSMEILWIGTDSPEFDINAFPAFGGVPSDVFRFTMNAITYVLAYDGRETQEVRNSMSS